MGQIHQPKSNHKPLRNTPYLLARLLNDISAIRHGRIGKRILPAALPAEVRVEY